MRIAKSRIEVEVNGSRLTKLLWARDRSGIEQFNSSCKKLNILSFCEILLETAFLSLSFGKNQFTLHTIDKTLASTNSVTKYPSHQYRSGEKPRTWRSHLPSPHDEVNTTVRFDHTAYLAHTEAIRCFFKRLLHHTGSKPAQITALCVRWTIRVLAGEFSEYFGGVINLRSISFQYRNCFFFAPCDVCLFVYY